VRRTFLIVVPKLLSRCTSQVLDRGAQIAAQLLGRSAQAVARGAATLSQQERNNSADSQRSRVNITVLSRAHINNVE
jgi:hypothetical protein